ncbi:MAG: flagellar basal body-associated FliL family protein [Gammaproteobacteria bacterium]|nr:flagellar basal body-associated FliL family protein [Gammaproteobacteria bacterium]
MAEEERNNEEGDLELDGPAKSSKKKLIIIIVAAVLGLAVIIGGTVGLTLMLVDGGSDAQQAGEEAAAEEVVVPKDAVYIPVKTMTVNFADKGAAQFLQVDISIMTYDAELIDLIKAHMPVIRNDMLNMLGAQTFKDVSTPDGKEALRTKLLLIVQKILQEQEAREGIEAIYFTKIIMQ